MLPDKIGLKKKLSIVLTIYEDGATEFSGECEFCGQFPCEHCAPTGALSIKAGNYEITQAALEKVKVVDWPLGDGGRPHQIHEEIEKELEKYGVKVIVYDSKRDEFWIWLESLHAPMAAPKQEKIEEMYRGEELFPANFLIWDWKEPRKNMVEDLNKAMVALKVPLKWKLGEKLNER